MTALERLRRCSTLADVALLLGVKPSGLSYILYKIDDDAKYYEFPIPKRSGGTRIIHAPIDELKLVQKRLSAHLSLCLQEITNNNEVEDNCVLSHGFRKGFSIVSNAKRHRNRRYVFNTDLSEFFPSINFGRVRGYFIQNRDFRLPVKVATIIAQIACRNGALPQGGPCSPIISNLIGNILDVHLARLASRNGCTYTRYADDLSFSTNLKDFPRAIATPDPSGSGGWKAGPELESRIRRAGFALNPVKTRMSIRNSRQMVTGLVVNHVVNVPKEYYKNTRAMCDKLFRTGSYDYSYGTKVPSLGRVLEPLHGRISYIFNVKFPKNDDGDRHSVEWKTGTPPGIYRMYRQFLDFKYFYGIQRPTILAEGKTDNVYLRAAIRALGVGYPSLATIADGKITLIPHLFKRNETTRVVQELGGGTGELQTLIPRYQPSTLGFSAPRPTAPAIILVDNDSGARPVFSVIRTVKKAVTPIDGTAQFYHIFGNLYVVPLPLQGGAKTDIESFLRPAVTGVVLNGKRFHKPNTGLNPNTHFGKAALADYVAKQPPGTVDFSQFAPILDAIVAVQADYQANGWR
ncbi:retron Ec67 family RNA-directed DNA polymerase/endonuclease [Brevundimonas sp. DWR2-3-1b1]|uniref:retron Ec67 family RNA-directed DNA polymerase/endonuclease n=1 Tax=unclassified Brevundimonas TaxID=2622653 RepID=UPI003CEE4DA1